MPWWGESRLIDAYRPDEACTLDVMDTCDAMYGAMSDEGNACREGARDRYLFERPRVMTGDSMAYMRGYSLTGRACAPNPYSAWWW